LIRAFGCLLAVSFCVQAQVAYKVRLSSLEGGGVRTLSSEDYVAAVLAGESSTFTSDEALKAMAVAARTYAAQRRGRHAAEGFDFCSTTHCQRVAINGANARLKAAAGATEGQLLWFEGKPAFTVYTRDCGGKTEDVRSVWPEMDAPYLRSVTDRYCMRQPDRWSWSSPEQEIVRALKASELKTPEQIQQIAVVKRTESGRAQTLLLAGSGISERISAGSFRFAVGRSLGWNTIRSTRFEIRSREQRIEVSGQGEGHGVGLCQRGAEEMGRQGFTFHEILRFYYPGTVLSRRGSGLRWSRLGGERLAIFSTQPAQDQALLPMAERILHDAETRTGLHNPGGIAVYVYPDLDTFRNATGEPGWVAAHTSGLRIDLQPQRILQEKNALQGTLRHEFIHALIESKANTGLPVWFREGLTLYLSSPSGASSRKAAVSDRSALERRSDQGRTTEAYAEAYGRVAGLVQRYGETTVAGWLRSGLPREVSSSSTSRAPTNSR
jgi:stage II sporulation protein D